MLPSIVVGTHTVHLFLFDQLSTIYWRCTFPIQTNRHHSIMNNRNCMFTSLLSLGSVIVAISGIARYTQWNFPVVSAKHYEFLYCFSSQKVPQAVQGMMNGQAGQNMTQPLQGMTVGQA
jgi:hypothetical protein